MTLKIRATKENIDEFHVYEDDAGIFVKINGKYKALFCHDGKVHLYGHDQVSRHQGEWKEA